MSRNIGKIFEDSVQRSMPDYVLMYRLPDSAQSFEKNKKLRFSRKNPFDYLLWDSNRHVLYALEMKTVAGNSISFERAKNEKRNIHYHQIEGLNKWNAYDGIICGFIIEFRKSETTVFLNIDEFNRLMTLISKFSFTIEDLEKHNIKHQIIPQEKLRTRYKYDFSGLLEKGYFKNEN